MQYVLGANLCWVVSADSLNKSFETQDTLSQRNLLKYRAEILKYQGMCLQYQASLLEKKATQLSSPSTSGPYQTIPGLSSDQRHQAVYNEREEYAMYRGTEDMEGPLDLTVKSPAAGPHLHTQSEHMPRIFFSRLSASNVKFWLWVWSVITILCVII